MRCWPLNSAEDLFVGSPYTTAVLSNVGVLVDRDLHDSVVLRIKINDYSNIDRTLKIPKINAARR